MVHATSISHSYYLVGELDVATISQQDIRFAYVLRLPFRLRVGTPYRHRFAWRDGRFEIILSNRAAIPEKLSPQDFGNTIAEPTNLFTDAVIVLENPKIDQEAIEKLRTWDPESKESPPVRASEVFAVIEAWNQFIIAFATATNEIIGCQPLRTFSDVEFLQAVSHELPILCPVEFRLTDDDCEWMLALASEPAPAIF